MVNLANQLAGIRRSRRHLIKAGLIGASAIFGSLTKTRPTAADDGGGDDRGGDDRGGDDGRRRCFLKGTIIRTANGDRKVEDLSVGDLLPTVFGGLSPVQGIGRYSLKKSDPTKAWVKDVLPVRVARSALGPDMPHADLYVTKAHALLIDGVLVTAGSLVNGTTVTLYDARENNELEFFHIKLEHHNAIYAEGAPCETALAITQEEPCAPLLHLNGGRSEVKSRFRSAISPWIDRRQKFDVIRDQLEDRGFALLRESVGPASSNNQLTAG